MIWFMAKPLPTLPLAPPGGQPSNAPGPLPVGNDHAHLPPEVLDELFRELEDVGRVVGGWPVVVLCKLDTYAIELTVRRTTGRLPRVGTGGIM
jgi:hypothetical protein